MIRIKGQITSFVFCLAGSLVLCAQVPNPTTQQQPENGVGQAPSEIRGGVPVYKMQVVGRDIPAINYFHRKGATKIGFEGTSLLPTAKGTAKVNSQLGRTQIELDLRGLTPANGFGPEYLTYVLWAITPEGRPVNLGEVLPTGGKDKNTMVVTTNLQVFGLIITAEPYFAVTMPSDVVVMQNFVINDKTQGVIEQVNAHYSLLPRGAYTETAGRHTVLHPITRNERSPLELYEADNAVEIAEAEGADRYAADTLQKAKVALQNAQDIDNNRHDHDRRQTITYAREAVQAAEDARIITVRKMREADEAANKKAADDAQLAAQQSALAAQQQAEARARAQKAAEDAEARAAAARSAQQAAEQSAQQATQQAEQARERLKQQLSQVLQTKETARGLIMNMSDVLFDFNKYTLKPEAREKLAKVSGILLAYPGLKLQVEGYTDNIGSDEYNQKLSEQRADSVKDYLVSQSVADSEISATGYGKSDPIADNSTSTGRSQNRRVQLVVSGEGIGVQQSAPGNQSEAPPATNPATPTQPGAASPAPPNPSGTSQPPQR
ncbi:OmpA family protein [Acidicapsa dinghuensis]|uniref:OmpA family protein n=1 Tax=Acidicapsa dinghuensis TaxID=2218256 RepID=A0ABW1EQN6_9BACT|nr:OmpA family protein [Acidicapsa dinghuensis]